MATARPFAYNPGPTIPGTSQIGDLSIGFPTSGFTNSPQYWNGPDEELGYVIAQSVPANTQPTPLSGVTASVGFFRSPLLTENSFVEYTNSLFGQNFTGGTEALVWLNANGYWTSYVDTYKYEPSVFLPWPSSTAGYTLYNGGFTSSDDGFSSSPITLPTTFSTDGQSSNQLYLSTNGYFTIGSGSGAIITNPQQQKNPAAMCGNPADNWLQPGLTNTDGDIQNWYYTTGTNAATKFYVKNLVYSGTYGNTTRPTSYVINFFRDGTYQWLETRVKLNVQGNAGPHNDPNDVSQIASTTSRVWRGDLNGQNWVYLGTGTVIP